jgi:hypothetical protein
LSGRCRGGKVQHDVEVVAWLGCDGEEQRRGARRWQTGSARRPQGRAGRWWCSAVDIGGRPMMWWSDAVAGCGSAMASNG